MNIESIFPTTLEFKYDHVKIDDLYASIVVVVKYETNIKMIDTIQNLIGNNEVEIFFHIKRENKVEVLKKLTNIIAESSSEINSVSKNQIDINVLDSEKRKAYELRRKIQVDNEQVYKVSTYIVIKDKVLSGVLSKQKKYINTLYAKQIVAKPSNFRQKEAYIASLPLVCNHSLLSKHTYNVFTEKALVRLFPFFNKDILDKNGTILGKSNGNLCSIDMFSDLNNNYNMCIFGTSGAGKSYFVKLMIIKNAYKGIRQIIIDPEGEYVALVKKLGGHIYNVDNYNPFEINEEFAQNENFFQEKVEEIMEYVKLLGISLESNKLEEMIIETYQKCGIGKNKESLYEKNTENKIYIKPKYIKEFPRILDLLEVMKKHGSNKFMESLTKISDNENTSSQNKSEIYCFNLRGKNVKMIEKEMRIFMPKIYQLLKQETLIYFDEIWKGVSLGKDRYVIENIYNMFKTLRKRKAGIVAISQDICDLFKLDDGAFGKSILNNTYIKMLFKMEWQDVELLSKMLKNIENRIDIQSLPRGTAFMSMGSTNFNLEIKATDFEHKLIEGEEYEKDIGSNEQ